MTKESATSSANDATETQNQIASGRPALLVSDPEGVRAVALPRDGVVTLGRSPECDVVLRDSGSSRKHAALTVGRVLTIEDLSSHNGTIVAGKRATPGQAIPLGLGAVVQIGASSLVLYRPADGVVAPDATKPSRVGHASVGVAPVDPAMTRLYAMLEVVGPSALPVIILGETGTGKDVFARAIHASSSRSTRPFVAVNCAALPEHLMESELFGHERGAFTSAVAARMGLIEAAEGGTLFLDEIAELPLAVQAKLLRVLETGEIRRVGAIKSVLVDVRYVAATNRDLQAEVMENAFRVDLFYRLNGFSFVLPPLRERPLDVVGLARHFATSVGGSVLSAEVEQALAAHDWPGNARELRTTIERAAALARGGPITIHHLMLPATGMSAPARPRGGLNGPVIADDAPLTAERERLVQALGRTSGNQKEAARLLGISPQTLVKKIERHGIGRPRKPS